MDIITKLKDTAQYIVDGKVDFVAQKRIERTTFLTLTLSTLLSFLLGYLTQSLPLSIASFSLILIALLLAFVPNWPYLNRHPVQWRPSLRVDATTSTIAGWGTESKAHDE